MTLVEFYFVVPTGEPLANSQVEIQLSKSTFTDAVNGIAMPRPLLVTTDAQGKVVLPLWPSTAYYYAQVSDSSSDAELFYKFIVPNVPEGNVVRMQDLVIDAPISNTTYDEAALAAIHEAKVNARASELAAKKAAADTAVLATEVAQTAQTVLTARDQAELSAFNAAAKAAEALDSKNAAAASATAAAGSATSAADSAVLVTGKVVAAEGILAAIQLLETSATAQASTATQKATEASQSAATASAAAATTVNDKNDAAASAAAALTSKNQAATSATAAATSATAAEAAADLATAIAGGDFVTKFNNRKGAVTLTLQDVTDALGFTPYSSANPSNFLTAAGTAAAATKLATARNINGVAFDGTADITVVDASKLSLAGGTLTGGLVAPSISVDAHAVWHAGNLTNLSQLANDTNFITAAANVASATKLVTARKINGVSFDGTADITVADETRLLLTGGTLTGGLSATALTVGEYPVWHSGNFTPAPFPPVPAAATANINATVNTLYHLDSSAGSFELVLPAVVAENSWIWIVDAKGSCGTKPVTIKFNGNNFGEVLEDILMDVSNDSIFMVFKNSRWVEQ